VREVALKGGMQNPNDARFKPYLDAIKRLAKDPYDPANNIYWPWLEAGGNEQVGIDRLRMIHADDCLRTYRATVDKPQSDITTREFDAIKLCKAIDSYPPFLPQH